MKQKSFLIFLAICLLLPGAGGVCLALDRSAFDCRIDFVNKNLNLNLDLKDKGIADIKGSVSANGEYIVNAFLRHFKLGETDILTDFKTAGVINYSKEGVFNSLKGKAWTQRTLLNLKPVKEALLNYELCPDALKIESFTWANMTLSGTIQLKPVCALDLVIEISKIDMKAFCALAGITEPKINLEGIASGRFNIKGPLGAVKIEGKIQAGQGRISQIEFNSMRINMEGIWPILRLEDSQIIESSGIAYNLGGQFNIEELSDFSHPDHKIMVFCSNNAMRFQDWVIKRVLDNKGQDMVEAEYPIKKNQALKMRIKNQEETLAWERTVKF